MGWTEGKLGLSETIGKAATATDGQAKLGRTYGGQVATSVFLNGTEMIGDPGGPVKPLIALYGYNSTSMTAKKVVTHNTIGIVEAGEMVYIPDAGKNGVLVLVGGNNGNGELVSCLNVVYSSHKPVVSNLDSHRDPLS